MFWRGTLLLAVLILSPERGQACARHLESEGLLPPFENLALTTVHEKIRLGRLQAGDEKIVLSAMEATRERITQLNAVWKERGGVVRVELIDPGFEEYPNYISQCAEWGLHKPNMPHLYFDAPARHVEIPGFTTPRIEQIFNVSVDMGSTTAYIVWTEVTPQTRSYLREVQRLSRYLGVEITTIEGELSSRTAETIGTARDLFSYHRDNPDGFRDLILRGASGLDGKWSFEVAQGPDLRMPVARIGRTDLR